MVQHFQGGREGRGNFGLGTIPPRTAADSVQAQMEHHGGASGEADDGRSRRGAGRAKGRQA
jgi:hypothetical protein